MRCRILSLSFMCILLVYMFLGCSSVEKNVGSIDNKEKMQSAQENRNEGRALIEDRNVYLKDKIDSVIYLYVTVLKDNNILNGKVTRMEDLNNYSYNFEVGDKVEKPKVEVIVQEGSQSSPETGFFGYGTRTANATMEPRGHAAANAFLKSYKIKLYDKAGLWNNQRVLNLNKHENDFIRARNKLSFDYFKLIPNLTSLRTQFVHLYIKDLSDDTNKDKFVDYGLYTHIEQPNKMFLRSHGLDPNAHLYKAENFEFLRYAEQLKNSDDPVYKKEQFEKVLSIEGNEDHRKLLSMLEDVNNYNVDINKVVEKHFNRDNMLSWLAVNILTGNYDTVSQNFMLYSPLNSDTWYFLPWDYDGAWGQYNQIGSEYRQVAEWQPGLSNYWGMVLFNRFFKDQENVRALNNILDSLVKIINKENTTKLLDKYYNIVHKYVNSHPDLGYLPSRVDNFDAECRRIAELTEKNRDAYYKNLEKPMPIYLGDVITDSNLMKFSWGRSFDLQGDSISYSFEISTDPDFTNIVVQRKALIDTEINIDKLKGGIYYWRVIILDTKGNRQTSFDDFEDSKGVHHYGVRQFIVKSQ